MQGWKSTVKGRQFILALHDYFLEKATIETENRTSDVGTSASNVEVVDEADSHDVGESSDKWAIAHINPLKIQPLLEAFDDDGTGYVSLKEANDFAESRPAGWRYVSKRLIMSSISDLLSQFTALARILGVRYANCILSDLIF
jgi:hypothetical protein